MHISLHGTDTEPLSPLRVSDKFLKLNEVGETLEELRDADFLRPHGTSDYAVKYIERGQRQFDLGNGWETIGAGTVLLYKPGDVQSCLLRRTDMSNEFFVHFSGTAVAEIWRSLGFEGRRRVTIGEAEDVVALWREIILELIRNRPGSEQMVNAKLLEMLTLISRRAGCTPETAIRGGQAVVGNMWDDALAPALQQIHVCYNEVLTLDRLAELCHLSKYYFSRRFRESMGMSPHRYVTKVRIMQAKRLLAKTDADLTEIAAAVGIPAEPSFRAAFRRETGTTPLEYRKSQEQEIVHK